MDEGQPVGVSSPVVPTGSKSPNLRLGFKIIQQFDF